MSEIFIRILNMSFSSAIVALVVILARLPLKKAPKTFSYILWGVVLFHLICPFRFESVLALLPTHAEPISRDIVFSHAPTVQSGYDVIDTTINNALNNTLRPVTPTSSVNPISVLLYVGSILWLCGIAALFIYSIISYTRLKRRVYDATLIEKGVYETDMISTAFVFGFFSPKIYVPTSLSKEQLELILRHEREHLRRFDHLVKPFAFLALALHWFNPVIWVSYFLMTKDMEMACDEGVLKRSSEDIRQIYSTSLLQLSSKRTGILSPLAFGENDVKSRVRNILRFKKPAIWLIVIAIALVGGLSVSLAAQKPIDKQTDSFITGEIASVDIITYPSHPEYDRYYSSPDKISSRTTAPLKALAVDPYGGEFDMIWELKTEGYKDLPLNEFNAAVQAKFDNPAFSSTYDKLVSVIVPGSSEYQFITETFGYSVAENISPLLGHPIGFSWNLTKYEDPYSTGTGEIFHNFMFTAFYSAEYRIKDMAAITVGARDELIATYQTELQNAVRTMSKEQLRADNIQSEIQQIAENLERQLSTSNFIFENAEISSIELLDYPTHGDQQIYSSDPVLHDFSASLSPDGKTRLEWAQDNSSNTIRLHFSNAETGESLHSCDYPSDSRFTVVWREDSEYVAVGYTNSKESRIVVYDTNQSSSVFGKGTYSHEFVTLYNDISAESSAPIANPDYFMQPAAFNNIINNNSTSLIYLVSWDNEDGNRLSRPVNWNFTTGEYSFIAAVKVTGHHR